MTPHAAPASLTDNLRGAAWMCAAMLGFALEDMALKTAAQTMPVGLILALFGAGGAALFALWVRFRGERLIDPAMASRAVALRSACEMAGRAGYTLAIALAPLSTVSAILQAAPLVVVAGAALVFGERVGPRRWAAVAVGFAGVLLILRPGTDGFEAVTLFAILGMAGFAGRDLATRAARGLSNAQLGFLGFAVMVPTGLALFAFGDRPAAIDLRAAGFLALAICLGSAAYASLTEAMRTGDVGVVTPFRYTRLVFGVALGVLVFGERPDAATLAGGAIIIVSGVYALLRSHRAG